MNKTELIKDYVCILRELTFLNPNTAVMLLECSDFKYMPGQFLMLELKGYTLRRPFVICSHKNNLLKIIFHIKGKGTQLLSKLSIGTSLNVMAPLGNFFPLPKKQTNIFLLGGGIGTVTLLPLAESLYNKYKISMFIGAKTLKELILIDEFKKYGSVYTSTDDGSCGTCSNVVDLFTSYLKQENIENQNSIIYACGPNVMLKCISNDKHLQNIKCYVSLEERMACGVGACVCCVVNTINGLQRTCKDGPVFDAKQIVW